MGQLDIQGPQELSLNGACVVAYRPPQTGKLAPVASRVLYLYQFTHEIWQSEAVSAGASPEVKGDAAAVEVDGTS